jgi:hypothetical protein
MTSQDPAAPHPGSDDPTDTGGQPGDDGSGPGSGDGGDGPDATPARRQDTARGQVASLQGVPRPPRRTGVFLDPQDLRTHVSDLLRSIVGPHTVDPFGNFMFDHESVRIFVTVSGSPIGPVVGVFSVTNADLELDGELAKWLARTNHRLMLGTLSWDDDNDAVWLRHNVLGTYLDAPELQAAVRAVSTAAVAVAGEVHERFGGRRFGDEDGDETPSMGPQDMGEDLDTPHRTNTTGYL